MKKMTGAEMISKERKEQIEKHNFTVENDSRYSRNELIKGALFAINSDVFEWPRGWDSGFRNTILKKTKPQRLAIAGAFLAAEIDVTKFIKAKKRKK